MSMSQSQVFFIKSLHLIALTFNQTSLFSLILFTSKTHLHWRNNRQRYFQIQGKPRKYTEVVGRADLTFQ
jgi:hypothetical protein